MAKRETNIHIEDALDKYKCRVFSDLIKQQIMHIEEVINVDTSSYSHGYLIVYIDKRYSHKEVKKEIKRLGGS